MTSYSRGDVVLVCYPSPGGKLARLRPAVVLHNTQPTDTGVSVIPLTPKGNQEGDAFRIEQGSYEAARMGLISSLWLDVQSSFDVPLALVEKQIGQCPYGLIDKAVQKRRGTLASVERGARIIDQA